MICSGVVHSELGSSISVISQKKKKSTVCLWASLMTFSQLFLNWVSSFLEDPVLCQVVKNLTNTLSFLNYIIIIG